MSEPTEAARVTPARVIAPAAQPSAPHSAGSPAGVLSKSELPPPARISGEAPILLFPYRLETRFVQATSGPQLWVRVYPDQLVIDAHRSTLSNPEQAAGNAYWSAVWAALQPPTSDSAGPWRALVGRYGAPRAAWIAAQTWPSNWPAPPVPSGTAAGADPPTPNLPTPVNASWPAPIAPSTPTSAADPTTAYATLLPREWIGFLYSEPGTTPQRFAFGQITPDLAVGPDLSAAAQAGSGGSSGMSWMLDFDQAQKAGMATVVALTSSQAQLGFSRLVVVGLVDPGTASVGARLQSLLDSQHFTQGVALVPRGAPTKNTDGAPAAFTRQDPGAATSLRTETGSPLLPSQPPTGPPVLDGDVLAAYLGVDRSTFFHVTGADRTDQQNAADMARVLWYATIGYLFRHLAGLTPVQVENVRTYYLAYVVGRGPVPPIRIGSLPYGILPVTDLSQWTRGAGTPWLRVLLPALRQAGPQWLGAAMANTPRVGKSANPDADLAGIVGMNASPVAYNGRWAPGPNFLWNSLQWFSVDPSTAQQAYTDLIAPARSQLQPFGIDPTIFPAMRFAQLGFAPDTFPVGPTVQDAAIPLSETKPLAPIPSSGSGGSSPGTYLDWLGSASIADVQAENFPGGTPPTALLYKLVRQAVLNIAGDYATDAAVAQKTPVNGVVIAAGDIVEPEFVGFGARTPPPSRWQILNARVPGVPLLTQPIALYPATEVADFLASLGRLSALPTAELDRLLGETLDTLSTRLDAWMTSVPTWAIRPTPSSTIPPRAIGGYAWVEGLTPDTTPATALTADETTAVQRLQTAVPLWPGAQVFPVRAPPSDNGGFIHAPSVTQGAAAAILREGYLSHFTESNGQMCAVNLSSRRVRLALGILDAVRAGQRFGAVLGQRFEATLATDGANAQYIPGFRAAFPLVANQLPSTSPPPDPSLAAAPNVVDGAALQLAWANGSISWGPPLPNDPGTGAGSIAAALDDLSDVLDAVGDVSLSESVFQIVRGNPGRSGGILDAINQGASPPEVQVTETPRPGVSVTHRVLVAGPSTTATPAPSPAWTSGSGQARALTEPWLSSFLTTLLPDPKTVACQISYDTGPPIPSPLPTATVTLDKLDLGPLDLLTLPAVGATAQLSELEQRLLYYAAFDPSSPLPAGALDLAVTFDLTGVSPGYLSVPQYLNLVQAARDLMSSARALRPEDLVAPIQAPTLDDDGLVDSTDLSGRVNGAVSNLGTVTSGVTGAAGPLLQSVTNPNSLPTTALLNALRSAMFQTSWYGFPGSIPPPPQTTDPGVALVAVTTQPGSAGAGTVYVLRFPLAPSDSVQAGTSTGTIRPPSGTTYPTSPATCTVNGQSVNLTIGSNGVQFTFPAALPARSVVTIAVPGLVLPSGVTPSFGVATSGGTVVGSPGDAILPTADILDRARRLMSALLSRQASVPVSASASGSGIVLSNAVGGALSDITASFTTSANGGLSAKAGTVTLVGPAGTTFPGGASAYKLSVGSGTAVQVVAQPLVDGSSVTITVPTDVPFSSSATLEVSQATLPPPGTYGFSLRTSADSVSVVLSSGIVISGSSGTSVQSVTATAATPASLSITFGPTSPLTSPGGTITIWGPAGLVFSARSEDYSVDGNALTQAPLASGPSVVLQVPAPVTGSSSTIKITGVRGPAAGSYVLTLATSADPVGFATVLQFGARVVDLVRTVEAAFGRGFVLIPRYTVPNLSELTAGIGDSGQLLGKDPTVIESWVQQSTHVRPGVAQLDLVAMLGTVAAGAPTPSFQIAQLPYRPNDAWLGGVQPETLQALVVALADSKASNQTTYTIQFQTGAQGSLGNGASLTIVAPSGTSWPAGGGTPNPYQISSSPGGAVSVGTVTLAKAAGSASNNRVDILLPTASIDPSQTVSIQVTGVTNPSTTADGCSLLAWTSAEPTSVTSNPYSITGVGAPPAASPPSRDRVALVFVGWPGFTPDGVTSGSTPVAGLTIDAWAERIPSSDLSTGLAFHHTEPWSQAPQALLLAVNPVSVDTWPEDPFPMLRSILESAIDLTKIRTVDLQGLGALGQLLPAIFLPYNQSNETIATALIQLPPVQLIATTGGQG